MMATSIGASTTGAATSDQELRRRMHADQTASNGNAVQPADVPDDKKLRKVSRVHAEVNHQGRFIDQIPSP